MTEWVWLAKCVQPITQHSLTLIFHKRKNLFSLLLSQSEVKTFPYEDWYMQLHYHPCPMNQTVMVIQIIIDQIYHLVDTFTVSKICMHVYPCTCPTVNVVKSKGNDETNTLKRIIILMTEWLWHPQVTYRPDLLPTWPFN